MKKKVASALLTVVVAAGLVTVGKGRKWERVYAADQSITVAYEEPTTSVDDAALTDLDHTNIYYSLNSAAPVKGPNIAASSASGGGTITGSVMVTLPSTGKHRVELWATATDTSGNESGESNRVSKFFDFVAPRPPSNVR